jgi:Domain of unknown function (DUF4148)
MKKVFVCLALAAGALTLPVISFAQSNSPVTRAEVRADLVRLERAGYDPRGNDNDYPAEIQAAEAKVAAQVNPQQADRGFGGVPFNGTLSSGAATHTSMHSTCVGPASFCNIYFGS